MAKRLSVSSQPEELVRMTSEDIRNRKWSEAEKEVIRRAAAKQAAGDDSDIDYSDIPRLTAAQLASMVRLRDVRRKQAVSVRLDPEVLDWLKSKGEGHLTRINDILANLMEAERKVSKSAS
ncbi:MAG: BrnA antitoxin family protein [Terracidiphilus sp.]